MALPNMVAEKASQERVKYYGLWISEVHEIDDDDLGVNVVPVTGN
jgi:ribosomal protein L20A (L18A)